MWYPILRFVSFCGVISNAFIVAFTSSFCQDFFEVDDVSISQRLYVVLVFEVRNVASVASYKNHTRRANSSYKKFHIIRKLNVCFSNLFLACRFCDHVHSQCRYTKHASKYSIGAETSKCTVQLI